MKIVLVDGFKIRNSLDTEFGMLERSNDDPRTYTPKFYIPKGETWIDHIYVNEIDWLLLIDKKLGHLYGEEYYKARLKLVKEMRKKKAPEFVIEKKKQGKLTVCLVNGAVIRRYLDPEFYCGGHDLVYDYVPKNTIWLDMSLDECEVEFVLLHEAEERKLMAKRWSYDAAHEMATVLEKHERRKYGACYPGDYGFKKSKSVKELINGFKVGIKN